MLLLEDNSVSIDNRNIQALAIELYKIKNDNSPEIMNDVFPLKEQDMYCSRFPCKTRNIHTTKYGTETFSHLGPKFWNQIPEESKWAKSLKCFKEKIKLWVPNRCRCRHCKVYIANLGFVDTTT